MGRLLFLISLFILFSFNSYGQENNWTKQHLGILKEYGLEKNDHRGITLTFQNGATCDNQYNTIVEAIEAFFSSPVKKDLTSFCISPDQQFIQYNGQPIQYNGQPLELFQIISLYLQIKTF